ncbi:MAG: tetratricopeptide repeat protein, partial [Gloeotrichia echinulata HAB0833]
QAIDYHEQALAVYQDIGNKAGEANVLNTLGSIYKSQGQYQQAIDYHEQALAVYQDIGNTKGEIGSLQILSNIYKQQGKIRKAQEYQKIGLRRVQPLLKTGQPPLIREIIISTLSKSWESIRILQLLKLLINVLPFPDSSKIIIFKRIEQEMEDCIKPGFLPNQNQNIEQFFWLMDILVVGEFLIIILPVRLFQRFKASFTLWFLVGLVIVLIIWWIKK